MKVNILRLDFERAHLNIADTIRVGTSKEYNIRRKIPILHYLISKLHGFESVSVTCKTV